MNIWLLTSEYPPFFGGGIGTYCAHTVKMLSSHGHHVTVFVTDDTIDNEFKESTEGLVRVVRFNSAAMGRGKACGLGHVAALSYELSELVEAFIKRDGPPDVIESQEYLGLAYFLLQKKRILWPGLSNIPILVTLHTPGFICQRFNQEPLYHLPSYWQGEMEQFCIRAADGVISPSRYLLDVLHRHMDLEGIETRVVPYPFAHDGLSTVGHLADGALNKDIVFVGRLEYRKGIIQLLDYFAELWNEAIKVRLILVGGDTLFQPKNKMMSEYLRERYLRYFQSGQVIYEGKIHPAELPQKLRQACGVVIPSIVENFPNVALESMSLGQVVLASDSGGQREILEDGLSGYLFSHEKPETFKAKILHILQMDELEHAKIGENASQRIRELCSYETVYHEKIKVIERLVNKPKSCREFPFIRGVKQREDVTDRQIGSMAQCNGLLSIVIPYYNMGAYLPETLESISRISYQPHEIIVVDDGSDDSQSMDFLRSVAQTYPVRIVHKRNGGLASTRNEGALEAKGEFLAFLDADDMVASEYYEWAIRIMKAYNNVSFVGSWSQYFGASDGIWPTWNPEPPYILIRNMVASGSVVLRREDFVRYGRNDLRMQYGWEDYESIISLVRHGCRGVAIPKPLFKYRVRRESMLRQMKTNTMLYSYGLIAEKHKDFFEQYATEVSNLLNSNGPGYLSDNPTFEAPQPVQYVTLGLREMLFLILRRAYCHMVVDPHSWLAKVMKPLRQRVGRVLLR